MRSVVIILVLLLFAAVAVTQQKTFQQGAGGKGNFGAPVIKYSFVNNQGVLMLGGRGGWNVSPSLLLGGGLCATMTEVNGPECSIPNAPGPLDISLKVLASSWSMRPVLQCRPI